jgi:hypothetical protein
MTRAMAAPHKRKLSTKSNGTLAERVAHLEREMARFRQIQYTRIPLDWRATIGMFSGDETMKQIDEYARQFREADRRRARRGRGKSDRVSHDFAG